MELTVGKALEKGNKAYELAKFEEAEYMYKAILEVQPDHPDANHNMGVLLKVRGNFTGALKYFERALQKKNSISQFWLSYINTLINLGNFKEGKKALEEAKKLGLNSEGFIIIEKELNTSVLSVNINPPIEEIDKIILLLNQGKFTDVQIIIKSLLINFPRSVTLYNILGVCNARQGQYTEAVESYKAAISLDANFAEAHNNVGNAYLSLGQINKAEASYKKALKINPKYADAYNNLGNIFRDRKDLNKALQLYFKSMKIKSDSAHTYNNIGFALHLKGEQIDAINYFKKALEIKPNFPEAHINLGNSLKFEGLRDRAFESYQNALKYDPNSADAYNNIGNILRDTGKIECAITNYQRAIELQPNFPQAYFNMGNAVQNQGEFEKALSLYRKSIELHPAYAEAYNNIGVVFSDMGNFDEAIANYNEAIKINPNYAEPHFKIAVLLQILDKFEQSIRYFEQALNLYETKSNDFYITQNYLLKSLFHSNDKILFKEHLDSLIDAGQKNALVGSFCSRANLKYHTSFANPFCNKPLDFVIEKSLLKDYDFADIFVAGAKSILEDERVNLRKQNLLRNGIQTAGNIFATQSDFSKEIEQIIEAELLKYRKFYEKSTEGFLTDWPLSYYFYGWIVSMTSGGLIRPHIHENGWLSGSIYINVPEELKNDEGNLVLCIDEVDPALKQHNFDDYKKTINVNTGSICLFPSSLLHHSLPFKSNEERIVLAFDVIPKDNK